MASSRSRSGILPITPGMRRDYRCITTQTDRPIIVLTHGNTHISNLLKTVILLCSSLPGLTQLNFCLSATPIRTGSQVNQRLMPGLADKNTVPSTAQLTGRGCILVIACSISSSSGFSFVAIRKHLPS